MKFALLVATSLGLIAANSARADHLNVPLDDVKFSGSTFTFPSVLIDKDGYVVIHAMTADGPVIPASIGHSWVTAGTTENVEVAIDGPVANDTQYMVMLHYETNGNQTYDFGADMTDADVPATKADGSPYALIFRTAK